MTVLIHVHEGTTVSSFEFPSDSVRDAFEAEHRSSWGNVVSDSYQYRHLPDGTLDDPDSDTWIVVDGVVEYVDGDRPKMVCGCGDPVSHGMGYESVIHVEVNRG